MTMSGSVMSRVWVSSWVRFRMKLRCGLVLGSGIRLWVGMKVSVITTFLCELWGGLRFRG